MSESITVWACSDPEARWIADMVFQSELEQAEAEIDADLAHDAKLALECLVGHLCPWPAYAEHAYEVQEPEVFAA